MEKIRIVMNSIKRLVLGVISTLLLAAGFVRAADRLDPMNNSLRLSFNDDGSLGVAPPCIEPCDIASHAT